MKIDWLSPNRLEQLGLGLDVGEIPADAEGTEQGWVDPVEARLRMELARQALQAANAKATALALGQAPKQASDWTADYLRLRDSGWPWRVAAYIAWAASPKRERWPGTIETLATEILGLTGPRVIYKWRAKNPTIDEVVGLMQAAPLLEHRADVYQALIASASDADHRSNPDRKLYLELIGDYVPHSKMEISVPGDVDDLSQVSDAELDKMSGKILNPKEPEGLDGE